jgi:type IV secretion system protein VirB6
MDELMLFQFIGETVNAALNTYVNVTAGNVVSTFEATAVALTTLYYIMNGYMMIAGRVETPFHTFLLSAGKFVLISALALNADIYLEWVVESIRDLELGFTSAFAGSHGTAPDSVYAVVDDALSKGWGLSADLWERAGNRDWSEFNMAVGDYINAILIALATGVIGVPAGAVIVAAKAMLSLILGIGPFFIMCLMWPVTKQFFDRWFSVVMMYIFKIALVAAVLSFAIKIFLAFVNPVDIDSPDQSTLFATLQLLGMTCAMLWLLYTVQGVAGQIAGGISSAAITFGQLARNSMNMTTAPGRAGRGINKTLNPISNRLDPYSGLQTQSRRMEHLAMGRSIWARDPAYRQAVLQQMQNGWGKTGGRVKEG